MKKKSSSILKIGFLVFFAFILSSCGGDNSFTSSVSTESQGGGTGISNLFPHLLKWV